MALAARALCDGCSLCGDADVNVDVSFDVTLWVVRLVDASCLDVACCESYGDLLGVSVVVESRADVLIKGFAGGMHFVGSRACCCVGNVFLWESI